jgi:ABC-type sugar transport system substrate-binding protein
MLAQPWAKFFLFYTAFIAEVRAAEPEVALVVKIDGMPWFTAMENGIKKAGQLQR